MSAATQRMTAEELWRMPRDGLRHELVHGELRRRPPSGGEQGVIVVNLTVPLAQHVKAQQLGVVLGAETGFLIHRNPDTVRGPDIAFVRRERIPSAGIPRSYWPEPPDLAVEVVSPGDTVFEVDEKVQQWLAAGTRLVWVINPRQQTVTVYRSATAATILGAAEFLEGHEVIPGFHCRVADIFA